MISNAFVLRMQTATYTRVYLGLYVTYLGNLKFSENVGCNFARLILNVHQRINTQQENLLKRVTCFVFCFAKWQIFDLLEKLTHESSLSVRFKGKLCSFGSSQNGKRLKKSINNAV